MKGRQDGGAAIYLLGGALLVLILVGSLGLGEAVRASAAKARATRALSAALRSAAQLDLHNRDQVERTFRQVLEANLGAQPHEAELVILPDGGFDPLSEQQVARGAISARLEIPYRLDYLGRWLPELKLQLVHLEFAVKRNGVG